MPLPGTRVIPKSWSAHHQPVAAGALNGSCLVYDPDLATTGWDPATESVTVVEGVPIYEGPFALMATQSDRSTQQADDIVRSREYLARFPAGVPWMREGLLIKVVDGHADTSANGRVLHVVDAQLGTERFQRDVIVRDSTEDGPEVTP